MKVFIEESCGSHQKRVEIELDSADQLASAIAALGAASLLPASAGVNDKVPVAPCNDCHDDCSQYCACACHRRRLDFLSGKRSVTDYGGWMMSEAWERAQQLEAGWWSGFIGAHGRQMIERTLDWGHNRHYLPFLAETMGVRRPDCTLVEVGGGACGLGPWMHVERKTLIDPLAKHFHDKGIDLLSLGWNVVVGMTAEAYAVEQGQHPLRRLYDLLICTNVLDHTASVEDSLAAMNKIVSKEMLLAYDIREVATELHPATVNAEKVEKIMTPLGWKCEAFQNGIGGESKEPGRVFGRRIEWWKRGE